MFLEEVTYDVWFLVRYLFHLAWQIPFSIPFFDFGFTYGHLIYGSILISVAVTVLGRFLHEKGDGLNGKS